MTQTVVKLIDTTLCIGCKACEVACQEWNDQEFTLGTFGGTYQTMPDLAPNFWNLIKFNERETDGGLSWLMSKYQCMHCGDPGCLRACPAPGAIVQAKNGIVDFVSDHCIGCGYCITGCPFDVPRLLPESKKVYKCTLCSDRVAVGLEPACIKSCPTNCLTFGERTEMLRVAETRAGVLKQDGHAQAGVYNPVGVGGTNVLYVLKDASDPAAYGLPADPTIPLSVRLWKGPVKWLGTMLFAGGVLGSFFHYLKFGPKEEEAPEE
ncbi:MAG: formate dehydrogenase subunit beta [Bryobacteraceae bacterium]|nr:formate dehydrogenase subunit beta [Bryobacteraceae bacterium]